MAAADVLMAPAVDQSSRSADVPPCTVDRISRKRTFNLRGGHEFIVDDRYEVGSRLGSGAFGTIASGRDIFNNRDVAIKKINHGLENDVKSILREIRLLRHFDHENILAIYDIMKPPVRGPWNDIYLVLEKMDTDLHYVLHSNQTFSNEHAQWVMYQLLRGVKAIHAAKALHRDLKPSNLLMNRNCDLKICDFGLARGFDESRSPPRKQKRQQQALQEGEEDDEPPHNALTEYVVTRWYRAPELLVQNREYGQGVDLWSVGCILGECLSREVLFPGKDYLMQTRLIVQALGAPDEAALTRLVESVAAREYIQLVGQTSAWRPVARRMPEGTALAALDLMEQLLAFDAAGRPSAAQALGHPWFAALKGLNPEPGAPPFDFDFEEEGVSDPELRQLVYGEMHRFHPELLR